MQAVAFHHKPSASLNKNVSPLTAVHLADINDIEISGETRKAEIDEQYIAELDLLDRLPVWLELSKENSKRMREIV